MGVIIYTSPTCTSCQVIEEYLRSHGVEFRTVDVARDPKVLEALIKKTGVMTTPAIEVGNEVIIGFNKPKIDQLLGLGGNHGRD